MDLHPEALRRLERIFRPDSSPSPEWHARLAILLRELEAETERLTIARSLHDGYIQALAGTGGRIVVRLSHEEDKVALSVLDEGTGVALTPPDRAFHAFVTTGEPFDFAGLGLWASRLIVEQHGGTLTLEPSSNGAIFIMRLVRQASGK